MSQAPDRPFASFLGGEPTWDIALLFPAQGQWGEADYFSLNTNRLVEYSHGRVEVLARPTTTHQLILGHLAIALHDFVSGRRLGTALFAPLPVRLWPGTYRMPDVLFMRAENAHRIGEQFWDGADLVMEVVSTDRKLDLETKRAEYARAGIPEYWIVDPKLARITVLGLAGDVYAALGEYAPGDRATSALLPGFAVDVAEALAATS